MNTQQIQGSARCHDYHYTIWEEGGHEELQDKTKGPSGEEKRG